MEADAAYQGCLPSCELHSRSLAVRRTCASDLEIVHMWFTQSWDCAHALRNLCEAVLIFAFWSWVAKIAKISRYTAHMHYAILRLRTCITQCNLKIAQIPRLRGTYILLSSLVCCSTIAIITCRGLGTTRHTLSTWSCYRPNIHSERILTMAQVGTQSLGMVQLPYKAVSVWSNKPAATMKPTIPQSQLLCHSHEAWERG